MPNEPSREQEVIMLRQLIEQTYANNPTMLSALRANQDALDHDLRQLPSGTHPFIAINHLNTQKWFRDAGEAAPPAFTHEVEYPQEATQSDYEQAYQECHNEAIDAGALEPQGMLERATAGVLAYQGESFADTPVARARLAQWIDECLRRKGYSV